MEPPEKKTEGKRKNRSQNNLRRNFGIEKRNKVFVSIEYKTKEIFQSGAKKHSSKAKKHYIHCASPENIYCCKPGADTKNKKNKSVEPEDRFRCAVAENSEEKAKKPAGEFAFINGDTNAGRQNKNRLYSVKIKKPGCGLKNICRKNDKGIYKEF